MRDRKSILHELYAFCEWKPEPEYIQKPDNILPENISALWRWIKFIGPKKSLLDSITLHKERQLKWHIAVGDEGKVLAVLTDNILEIRTKRSDYATIAARTTVPRDAYPQWRKVVWSPDCSFIAVAYGNGVVGFFDLTASNLFNIPTDCSRPGGLECSDNTHAVADIIFMPLRVKDNKWSWEVLVLTFEGQVRTFLVSGTAGFARLRSARAAPAAAAAAAAPDHTTLYIAAAPTGSDPSSAYAAGITAWRLLNDEPYFKLSVVSDKHEADLANKGFSLYVPFIGGKNRAFIVSMSISPNGSKLACLHSNGEVSVWTLPLLKLVNRFPLAVQPTHDLKNPLLDVEEKDAMLYHPSDLTWWSDEEVILSRYNGRVSVCDTVELSDLLQKPQFIGAAPRLLPEKGATLALDCTRLDNSKSEPEPEETMAELTKELFKSILYAITDMETFQPRPKKITVVSRVYRLLAIKSTTPEDLFHRKIESGKYSEALELASDFNLDSDQVYQARWRKTPVSSDAIKNFLSKVSKKIWVVHQCADRLPESLPAAKELLQFGLQLTNTEIILEINKDREEDFIESTDDITLDDLNAYSSELLRCRHMMLFYKERLKLYEAILRCEKSTYVKDEYDRLRSNSLCHSAKELAKEGRISALTCLWPQINSVTMQLAVLDCLPETMNPLEYRHLLLPVTSVEEQKTVIKQQVMDWCQKEEFKSLWTNWSEHKDITPENQSPNDEDNLVETISKWYERRAKDIERRTGLCSHALTLLSLANEETTEPRLDTIRFYLTTLDKLLYDVGLEDVDLKAVEKMTVLETCHCFMRNSNPSTFVQDLKTYVIPFLKHNEVVKGQEANSHLKGLAQFLENLSVKSLQPVLMVLQAGKEFDFNVRTHLELLELCLFKYDDVEEIEQALALFDTIPKESDHSISQSELDQRTDSIRRLVLACRAVWRRRVPVCARNLSANAGAGRGDRAVHTLERLARSLALGENKPNQQDWEELLKDLLELQELLYSCVPKEKCYEIYASALLTSGDAPSIKLVSEVLTCENVPRHRNSHLVPYDRSVNLALDASKEYFNSASSLTDPALELAKCCLSLIKDDNAAIQEELDLIESLALLNAFNLTILPIQVRLCEDRLSLIEECLKLTPEAYLATHKLLHLAKLLRVPGDEQTREGSVTRLCVGAACAAEEGGAAAAAAAVVGARRLAHLRHEHAASLLADVAGRHAQQADNKTRCDLYAAAATFCAPADLPAILTARLVVDMERLHTEGTALIEHSRAQRAASVDDEFADAITTPVIEQKDFKPTPLSEMPLVDVLMQAWMTKKEIPNNEPSPPPQVHIPELYRALYPEHLPSSRHYDYTSFSTPQVATQNGPRNVLSGLNLEYSITREEDVFENQVYHDFASDVMYHDTALAISALVGSCGPPDLPLQLVESKSSSAVTACAVLTASGIRTATLPPDAAFRTAPIEVVRSSSCLSTVEYKDLITACIKKLRDSCESEKLGNLGFPVNRLMFAADEQYRKGTLFRLARSEDPSHVELAYSLALSHGEDPEELWAERVSANPTVAVPLPPNADKEKALQLLKERVYPTIEGSNYTALIKFFNMMKELDDKQQFEGLTPGDHVKLLKKAKAASKELDYKLLVSKPSPEAYVKHMVSIMRADKVAMLSKFLRHAAAAVGVPVPGNELYVAWLVHSFFSLSPAQESNKKWTQQFRQCASYFNKLTSADLVDFIVKVCFSDDAVNRVPAGTRSVMMLQAVDYCQQEHENDMRLKNESTWQTAGEELSRMARFLDNFHSGPVQGLFNSSDQALLTEIEKTHGNLEKLRVPLSRLLLEKDFRYPSLVTLLQCLNINIEVEKIFCDVLDYVSSIESLNILLARVAHYNYEVHFSPEFNGKVASKISELHFPGHHEMELLSFPDQSTADNEEDMEKVLKFSCETIKSCWNDLKGIKKLSEEELQSVEGRRKWFRRLLEHSKFSRHRQALAELLIKWPADRDSNARSLHSEYLSYLLSKSVSSESAALIRIVMRKPKLNEEELDWLTKNASKSAIYNVLCIILLSKNESMIEQVPQLIMQNKDHINGDSISHNLIKEILDAGLLTKLVATPFYRPIVQYLMEKNRPYSYKHDEEEDSSDGSNHTLEWAVQELRSSDHVPEAGHLHLINLRIPVALRGFSETILCFKDMFNQE